MTLGIKDELPLNGLDGGNLLAFLAALGTLRVLNDLSGLHCSMSWAASGGAMRPRLHFHTKVTDTELLDALERTLARDEHPALAWEIWNEKSADPRRTAFASAQTESCATGARLKADWLCAIGSDAPAPENEASDTPLRAPRTDYLLGNIRTILKNSTRAHLERALFAPWAYDDPLDNCSLKFEPSEDRRHAHQWDAPSGDPARKKRGNMLGANRLALEALPLFTCVQLPDGLAAASCSLARDGGGIEVTWPLWHSALSLDTVRSLLTWCELAAEPPDLRLLRNSGLSAIYRCHRQTIGKTRVFTPSRRIA